MKTRHIILYFIGLLAISSCDDMFEPAKENFRQLEDMTEESDYAHGLLMYGYGSLPYMTTTQTDIATDDATSNLTTNSYYNMATFGSWKAEDNPMSQWNNCKGGIQLSISSSQLWKKRSGHQVLNQSSRCSSTA